MNAKELHALFEASAVPFPLVKGYGGADTVKLHLVDSGETAGIWIGDGKTRPMIAIFSTPTQVGVGIYSDESIKASAACDICLWVDKDGGGVIQFTDPKERGSVEFLSFEDIRKLKALLAKS